jgi:hypothetical protein
VPIVSAPFKASFMLPVPEASIPAVEICSDRSAAGMIFSAKLGNALISAKLGIFFCSRRGGGG